LILALFFSDRLREIARDITRLIQFEEYDREVLAKIAELESGSEASTIGTASGLGNAA